LGPYELGTVIKPSIGVSFSDWNAVERCVNTRRAALLDIRIPQAGKS